MNRHANIFYIILLSVFLLLCQTADAQNRRPRRGEGPVYGKQVEKTVVVPDSIELARRDSLFRADSVRRADSVSMLSKSSLDMPVFSTAKDSMVEVFKDGQRKIYYYGDVSVKYQDMELSADYMEYDLNSRTVYAKGTFDSLSGEWNGRPKMTQGGKSYDMEELRYNFDSRKARITNMITSEDEGILHGRNIKMMDDNSINITKGRYTVCDAEHPHYYLSLSAAKVVDTGDSKKTIFGPACLVVGDVKIPFVGIPFGFIPKRPQRATGLLMPTFGEEQARGFYMRDLGMYFVFGDHFDLQVTGDYYTLGSWAVNLSSRYNVKYKFTGGFNITYSNDQTGEPGTPEFNKMTNFGISWNHSQDSKANPGTTFSASVDMKSPSNNRYNSTSLDQALQNQASSSISFSKKWEKLSLSINALHSQNSRDSSYSFTLPNLTLSVSTFYPFKRKERVGKEKLYEKISFAYKGAFNNKISFKASEFGQEGFLDKFQNGMTHDFTIGLPSFQLFKYLSISPSVSYNQRWFFSKHDYEYNPETNAVEEKKSGLFSTFGVYQNYSFSASMSTRIYGTFNFGKASRLQAIRHVISPTMSMSYTPNLATYSNGYRTLQYTDANGNDREYQYNLYSGQLYSISSTGRPSATASLSIANNLEAKVRDYADTTGKGTKKVKLIDQLNISTSYNFLAEQFKLSVISLSMTTNLFNKISLSASTSLDPYALDERGNRIDKFALASGQGLGRLNSISASASYSISGKGTIEGNDGSKSGGGTQGAASYYQRNYYHPVTGEFIPDGWVYYTNPNVPWSLSLSASFGLTPRYTYNEAQATLEKSNTIRATLSARGNIQLTPKMSLNMSTGFDFVTMKMTSTQISATYDLHCFNISVSWIPTGTYKSYSFRIAANANALADLLRFKKSSSYWDN